MAAVYTIAFLLVVNTPGNPFQVSERQMPEEVIRALEARYDIDDHFKYFFQYPYRIITEFDFGPSC